MNLNVYNILYYKNKSVKINKPIKENWQDTFGYEHRIYNIFNKQFKHKSKYYDK